jgi:hypothetical protein
MQSVIQSLTLSCWRTRSHQAFSKGKGELVSWVGLFLQGYRICVFFFSYSNARVLVKQSRFGFSVLFSLRNSSASSHSCFIPGGRTSRVLLVCCFWGGCMVLSGWASCYFTSFGWSLRNFLTGCCFSYSYSLLFINAGFVSRSIPLPLQSPLGGVVVVMK